MLNLQDPTKDESPLLHEKLLEAASNSSSGGAAFAWATVGGLDLLFDDAFCDFAEQNAFSMIIGVQSVTTPSALEKMSYINDELGNIIHVFLPENTSNLYHPKYSWFGNVGSGTLIVGSGNLTLGGLRDNWEAYATVPLNQNELDEVRTTWQDWFTRNTGDLVKPENERALERAEQNTGWTEQTRPRNPDGVGSTDSEFTPTPVNSVLVAEIPKSKNRWKQANFDMETYETFFGARIGTQRRMLFQSVDDDGNLGEVEKRPSVEVGSSNFRFELDAASGLDYPDEGRPIAVFLKLQTRSFLYHLSLPDKNDNHDELEDFLDERQDLSPTSTIRRVEVDVEDADNLSDVNKIMSVANEAFGDE